jgi:hypothetical protein
VMNRVVALPGEETLIGSWTALTQLSPAAQMINTSATTAAGVSFLGAPEQRDSPDRA